MTKVQNSVFQATLGLFLLTLSACMGGGGDGESAPYVAPEEPFPKFGKSLSYAVLSAHDVTNTGNTTIYGDIGSSSGSHAMDLSLVHHTGGESHFNDAKANAAMQDAGTAYENIRTHACDHDLSGQNLGGMTLIPGTYCFSGDANLDGLLTLDAQGNNRENFVFQVGGSLIAAANAGMRLIHSGESCNVLWQVTDSVNFNADTNFIGGIIAMGNANFENGSKLNGKIMSRTGSISLFSSEIYNNFCPWW